MATKWSCDDVAAVYLDPATQFPSSCKELCRFLEIRVRRNDCIRYCPDYFRCLKQTALPSTQTAITPSPSPASDQELALTFCLLATFGTFIVASLAISLFCFLWCKWKKTAPNRNNRGLLVTQTADAQVEQGLIAQSKFAVNELDAQKMIISDQRETNKTLLLANNENSLSPWSRANTLAVENDKEKAIADDTKSADSGFVSNHAGNSRECP